MDQCLYVRFMGENGISEGKILIIVMLAVFLTQFGTSWWVADSPYKTIILRDAGFSFEEIAAMYFTTSIILGVFGIGTSNWVTFAELLSRQEVQAYQRINDSLHLSTNRLHSSRSISRLCS